MRKAAGLLVELPPEEMESSPPLSSRDVPTMDDLDLDLPPEARLSAAGTSPAAPMQPKSVEEIVRDAEGPNLDEIQVDEAKIGAPGAMVSGEVIDFAAIYRAAGLPNATFGAEQMLETLHSLPVELPLETRRATVKAMLSTLGKTMGATPETVVADASRKLAALHSFAGFMEKKTSTAISKNEEEIAALEAEIDAKRTAIQGARSELAKIMNGCEVEADRLDDVLEFFSLDVGASKHAPTAHAPTAPDNLPIANP
jgi:hypothetical protein